MGCDPMMNSSLRGLWQGYCYSFTLITMSQVTKPTYCKHWHHMKYKIPSTAEFCQVSGQTAAFSQLFHPFASHRWCFLFYFFFKQLTKQCCWLIKAIHLLSRLNKMNAENLIFKCQQETLHLKGTTLNISEWLKAIHGRYAYFIRTSSYLRINLRVICLWCEKGINIWIF